MRFLCIALLTFFVNVEQMYADPGNGNGNTGEQGTGNGNAYARGREKHEAAKTAFANTMASDSGLPVDNFTSYAGNLANTLGQIDDAALARVFAEHRSQLP